MLLHTDIDTYTHNTYTHTTHTASETLIWTQTHKYTLTQMYKHKDRYITLIQSGCIKKENAPAEIREACYGHGDHRTPDSIRISDSMLEKVNGLARNLNPQDCILCSTKMLALRKGLLR